MLVAPLNWGLGHATRCIPVINALIKANFTPVIASDGNALEFLKKEFPDLEFFKLPSYNINYSQKAVFFKFHLLLKIPAIIAAIIKEKKVVSELIKNEKISGIISDNRFGVYSNEIPSVYITHQLKVLSGKTSWITSKIHQYLIKKFDVCWVPDVASNSNLSGDLSHTKMLNIPINYVGFLSRFKAKSSIKKHAILVILSGVEPQRTMFENKIIKELTNFKGKVVLVRGVLDNSKIKVPANFKVFNYLLAAELEKAIIQSSLVISRSGYSTIMDLAVVNANVLFVPTPGQFEQEYLAEYLFNNYNIPFVKQDKFKCSDIKNIDDTGKFGNYTANFSLENFSLFERKRKF